jgi:hypothetical protein
MREFKRGIRNPDFIKELKNNSYFQKMVKDEDLFIAIRNEYINVYYYGQSICKIDFIKRKNLLKWTTHKKYLGIEESGYSATGDYLNRIDELKHNAKKHKGKEKEQVKKHILDDKELCILDVEVTFSREQINGKDYAKRSIDYVTIEKTEDGKDILVFYEAKHITNSEIRSRTIPDVLGQILRYEEALHQHEKDLKSSYEIVLQNLSELNILAHRNFIYKKLNTEKLLIDFEPRLIIFGIDIDKIKNIHLENLRLKYGDKRLILRGKK